MAEIKKESYDSMMADEPHYPYGTQIELKGDTAEGIDLDSFSAGQLVEVRAKAFVKEKSEESEDGGEIEKELSLQLTDIEVMPASEDRADKLYGS